MDWWNLFVTWKVSLEGELDYMYERGNVGVYILGKYWLYEIGYNWILEIGMFGYE